MSIIGKALKGTITLIAGGLDYAIIRSANSLENKFGKNEYIEAVSEIGSNTVRVSETTARTLSDALDGGIDAGIGYLTDNRDKKNAGIKRMKMAGKEMAVGVKDGLVYTYEAGSKTAGSAVQAGKYYVRGKRNQARAEFINTKLHAKNLGKIVVIGLLALGAVNLGGERTRHSL